MRSHMWCRMGVVAIWGVVSVEIAVQQPATSDVHISANRAARTREALLLCWKASLLIYTLMLLHATY